MLIYITIFSHKLMHSSSKTIQHSTTIDGSIASAVARQLYIQHLNKHNARKPTIAISVLVLHITESW